MKIYQKNYTRKLFYLNNYIYKHQIEIEKHENMQNFYLEKNKKLKSISHVKLDNYLNKNGIKSFLQIQQKREISILQKPKIFVNTNFSFDKQEKHGFLDTITQILPKWISHCVYNKKETIIYIYLKNLTAFLTFLKYHTNTQFKMMVDVTTIDYPSRIYRFVLVYNLLSVYFNSRVIVKTSLQMGDSCDSVTPLYSSANWWEREAYDMFGVKFDNHPDLRRILTDYNFSGHPLKKDHPLHGVEEARYKDPEKRVIIQTSEITQELRQLSPNSSWEQIPKV